MNLFADIIMSIVCMTIMFPLFFFFLSAPRNTGCAKQQLDDAMGSFRDVGFINYFGMQRFGNSVIATYMVGK